MIPAFIGIFGSLTENSIYVKKKSRVFGPAFEFTTFGFGSEGHRRSEGNDDGVLGAACSAGVSNVLHRGMKLSHRVTLAL
jgi:hypothetical protein